MPENNPSQRPSQPEVNHQEKVLIPALNALGKMYQNSPTPIPQNMAAEVTPLMRELFDGITIGENPDRSRDIAEKYLGLNTTPLSLNDLSKEFNITKERIRQISTRFIRAVKTKIRIDENFSELPYYLPFYRYQIGSAVFGEEITQKEIKDKLPEDKKVKDLGLSQDAMSNLRQYYDGDADEDNLFTFLSRGFSTVNPETEEEIRIAFEKLGFETRPQQN